MNDNYLIHHGILGQKWGVRRYQNSDGTRTAAGKKRYISKEEKKAYKAERKAKIKEISQDIKDLKKSDPSKSKYLINPSARRNAAKKVLDENISLEEAYKLAKKYSYTTAALFAASAALQVSRIILEEKDIL